MFFVHFTKRSLQILSVYYQKFMLYINKFFQTYQLKKCKVLNKSIIYLIFIFLYLNIVFD